jgi:hypothetical protein
MLMELPQFSPLVQAVSEMCGLVFCSLFWVTTVYTSPAPVPLARESTSMCGLKMKAFRSEMLVTAPIGQHAPVGPSVPFGQAVVSESVAAVVRTIPIPWSRVLVPNIVSAMKKMSRLESTTTVGVPVPSEMKPSTGLLMPGSPPSKSAAQFVLDRCT